MGASHGGVPVGCAAEDDIGSGLGPDVVQPALLSGNPSPEEPLAFRRWINGNEKVFVGSCLVSLHPLSCPGPALWTHPLGPRPTVRDSVGQGIGGRR